MRHFIIFVAGTITLSAAAPGPAIAQDPGRIFGAMTRMLTAPLRQGFGPRIPIHRPPMDLTPSSRRNAIARAAAPQRAVAREPQHAVAREPQRVAIAPAAVQAGIHTGWAGAVFWPRAADDLVGYAFFPNEAGERFWAYGFNDISDGIFTPPAAQAFASARRIRDERTVLPAAATELCGSTVGAGAWADHIEQIVQPDAGQRELLLQLRAALAKADDELKAACPSAMPASQSARLDIMEERLRALHYATLTIRTPLEKFYGALTDEQKTRLNGASQTASPARICQTPASAHDRSAFALDPRARPNAEQRAYQEAMQKHLTDMAKFVAAACPQDIPATPLARLDAQADRLTVLLYAAMAMRPALDQSASARPEVQPRAEAPTPYPRPRPVQANATP
jgi:hypothetical protein